METLKQENLLYRAEIEQNLEPKIQQLLNENRELFEGQDNHEETEYQ